MKNYVSPDEYNDPRFHQWHPDVDLTGLTNNHTPMGAQLRKKEQTMSR